MIGMSYVIKSPEERFKIRENMTMSDNLGYLLSQILMNSMRGIRFNDLVSFGLAKTAALVQINLRREQLRFVDLKDSGELNETAANERLVRIMELKEEYKHLRFRMFDPLLIDENTDSWRRIFHTIRDRKADIAILDFVRIYNKWTVTSADYMILKALRDLECGEEEKRSSNKIVLAKEYEVEIQKREELLEAYLLDLNDIVTELDSEYNIFEMLANLDDEFVCTSERATFKRYNSRRHKPFRYRKQWHCNFKLKIEGDHCVIVNDK
ncbi:MAG: hypothetical protein II059_07080 [Clostridia bacterium]|nr:hypothetical protein [Clostridia bacterium]